ncbi:MAG: tRNA (adenosine(37)-N6)-dimethylallyltransferase MiaA [Bacteroidetes bacterium]|nr:tRNA (adenosine(37)-N6)-dimethylallyltransferase MiaA [Bacteroidota bacterium]
MHQKKFLLVIAGPTAIGKTSLAIRLAKLFQTEIISADSRQFFREMNIGTAKPSDKELAEIKHHFINTISVTDDYDAGQYEHQASELINELFKKHALVILAGGSGMYINAVCNGFDDIPEVNENIREPLNTTYKKEGIIPLQEQLSKLDPGYYNTIDLNNPQRLIRALEICLSTGLPYSSFRKGKGKPRDYSIIKIGLNTDREQLYKRINQRVDEMIEAGLIDEVKNLTKYKHLNALQTVGYKELFNHLDGEQSLEKAIEQIKQNTRNFAKRQLTWFRKDGSIKWFEPADTNAIIDYVAYQISETKAGTC